MRILPSLSEEIHEDEKGQIIPKPHREDFSSFVAYLAAAHTYDNTIYNIANRAFDNQFRKSMRRSN
jgi:hypothetical protein